MESYVTYVKSQRDASLWKLDKYKHSERFGIQLRIKTYAYFTFFLSYGMSHYFGATGE